MFWLVVVTTFACMAVASVMVFRNTRNAQIMDRRLARVRAWAVAVYGEPQKRHKQEGGGFSLRMLSSALLNIASRLVPVGAAERAKLKDLVMKAGFSPTRRPVDIHDGQACRYAGQRCTLLSFQIVGGTVAGGIHLNPDHPAGRSVRRNRRRDSARDVLGPTQRPPATPDGHGAAGRAGPDDALP